MWLFLDSPHHPIEGLQVNEAFIVWPWPNSPQPATFILQGVFSMPGVNHQTRPAEATVTLSLPVTGDPVGVSGEETITFRPFHRLWRYKLR